MSVGGGCGDFERIELVWRKLATGFGAKLMANVFGSVLFWLSKCFKGSFLCRKILHRLFTSIWIQTNNLIRRINIMFKVYQFYESSNVLITFLVEETQKKRKESS